MVCVSMLILVTSCRNSLNSLLKKTDYNFKLKKANEFYEKEKYEKARSLYENVIYNFKNTEQYEFIFYRLAYCSYKLKDIYEAQSLFKEYATNFPEGNKVEEMEYMYAYTFALESPDYTLDPTNTQKAIGLLRAYTHNYPNSDKVQEAQKIIMDLSSKLEMKESKAADLYFNADQFKAAAIYFNDLVKEYPESNKVEEYKFKAIQSLYKYAHLSIIDKQIERYNNVINEFGDFINRFPESPYIAQLRTLISKSESQIKILQNELTSKNQ